MVDCSDLIFSYAFASTSASQCAKCTVPAHESKSVVRRTTSPGLVGIGLKLTTESIDVIWRSWHSFASLPSTVDTSVTSRAWHLRFAGGASGSASNASAGESHASTVASYALYPCSLRESMWAVSEREQRARVEFNASLRRPSP